MSGVSQNQQPRPCPVVTRPQSLPEPLGCVGVRWQNPDRVSVCGAKDMQRGTPASSAFVVSLLLVMGWN